jgi:type IV pilus assembly protein PilM
MFLSSPSKYPIGLDISDGILRAVQLKKNGDKIKFQAVSKITLPKGIFKDGEIINMGEAAKKIKELIAKPFYGKFSSDDIIACLPEPKTFIKLIEIKKAEGELGKIIEEEMEKHIPVAVAETYYDWQAIGADKDKQKILIGAAPKNIVNQYTELLAEAKLSIVAMEIEPIAICRSLLKEEQPKFKAEDGGNYAIVDIGAKRSSITAYAKNTILFSFSLPISGNDITAKIAKTLKIENSQAEKAKIICGLDKIKAQGAVKEILYGMIKQLVGKIKKSLSYYDSNFKNTGAINKIILCGGGANIKDIDKTISEYTQIKVERGNALANLNEDEKKIAKLFLETHNLTIDFNKKEDGKKYKAIQDAIPSYATAIGLALRGVFIN